MQSTFTPEPESVVLNPDTRGDRPQGFTPRPLRPVHPESPRRSRETWARVLASSYLRFCGEALALDTDDSIENSIRRFQLFQRLETAALDFLQQEVRFLREDQPIHDLLLRFATHRLNTLSRAYYAESLTSMGSLATCKAAVVSCQGDVDRILQAL